MCEMIGKYGVGHNPQSYHDLREALEASGGQKFFNNEYRNEWRRTSFRIMCD